MYLVAGATGLLGMDICSRLRARGRGVRGLVRPSSDPERVNALIEQGAATVTGDLREAASLEAACRGATTVISTVNTVHSRQPGDGFETTDSEGHAKLIQAADNAGVKRFVFISFSKNLGGDDPLTRAKRETERRLARSGLAYTILRPSLFMEIWLGPHTGFDYEKGQVVIFGAGTNPISFISQADLAELAVRATDEPVPDNETIELGGPRAVTPAEVVGIFEARFARRFQVTHVPEAALRQQLEAATDPMARTFASLQLSYARGDDIHMDRVLERYPMRMRSVEDHASALAAQG